MIQTATTCGFWFRSQLHYQLSQTLCSLMAALAYISAFSALVWISNCTWRLLKQTWLSQKTQLSFQASPVSIDVEMGEILTGWTRQTDRQLFSFI